VTSGPATTPLVLVVDDEAPIRAAIARYLAKTGYHSVEAGDAGQALAQLDGSKVVAMVCDIRMPGPSGIELLTQALAKDSDLAVIMLTGVGEPAAAIECLKLGAADYLIKPVDMEELHLSLQWALRKRELEMERRELERWLAREVAVRTRELEEQTREVEGMAVNVLLALVDAVETTAEGGRGHSAAVGNLCAAVASRLALDHDVIETIRVAGRLHDIGRLALRDERVRRVSQSRPAELVASGDDADLAARILEPLKRHAELMDILRHQHERWDGKGPRGLKGEAIPMGARILTAANLYVELTETAQGRRGIGRDDAIANLRGLAGTRLDPKVLEALEQATAA
jgi:response regulator RpfG family c-di-GMP phosphodiesterase